MTLIRDDDEPIFPRRGESWPEFRDRALALWDVREQNFNRWKLIRGDKMDEKAKQAQRWHNAAHAIQTGVATEIEQKHNDAHSPKHLRTGLNTMRADHNSLVELLMAKGLITEEEYLTAIADGMVKEKERAETRLTERMGTKITLA